MPHFTASEFDRGWVYRGGAFQLGFNLWWSVAHLGPDALRRGEERGEADARARAHLAEALRFPDERFDRASTALGPLDSVLPHYREWIEHGPGDPYWKATSLDARWASICLPILHVAGWYNVHLDGNLANFVAMRTRGPVAARAAQRLVVGPWTQWLPALGDACGPERRFPTAPFDMEGLQLAWFGHHLADGPPVDLPLVRVFVMGVDEWRDYDDWPPPGSHDLILHLHSDGRANTRHGDGSLRTGPPETEEPDTFLYDPADPVPTLGGASMLPNAPASAGARDQRPVEERGDVLVFTSEVLDTPLVAVGPVRTRLFVASTAESADFMAKLVDVHPSGEAVILCDGVIRTVQPGASTGGPVLATELEIDLTATGNAFLPGHRVRLEVAGSNFPKFDRHAQRIDGSLVALQEGSRQTLFHDARRPSTLTLTIAPD